MTTLHADCSPGKISVYRAGLAPALVTQHAAPDHRPYIHPLLAPDGIGELTENEPGHHLWQHGLYVGLNDVNGVGFWTEGLTGRKDRDGTFHPAPLAAPAVAGNRAQWEVVTQWRSPAGEPILTETQHWTLTDRDDSLLLDLEWRLRADTDLRFGQSGYGGLFLRMPWRSGNDNSVLSSEGAASLIDAEGKRARWVALAMPLPERSSGVAGVALLDHPSNPEHPAPWRVDDNYGIAPSRSIAGEWFLPGGETTVSRYRLLAYVDGIDGDFIENEWRQFASEGK